MPGLKCADVNRVEPLAHRELFKDIEKEYGIDVLNIIPADNKGFAIYSKGPTCWLQRWDDNETEVIFSTGLYDYMVKRGFNNLLRLHQTDSGRYYILRPEGIYIMYDFIDIKASGFTFEKDARGMMRLLADFHEFSAGYIPPSGGKGKYCWGRWIEEYKKELNNLKRYRERVKVNGAGTPFEIMFLSDYDLFISRVEDSIGLLKRNGYLDYVEESMQKHQVCMGRFKQSNFYIDGQGIKIRTLKKCRYDIVEKDIAELIGRLAEASIGCESLNIIDLIDEFRSSLNIKNSMNIVKAFLLFPDEYIKICSRYFKGSEKWGQGEYMDKLRNASYVDGRRAKLAGMLL